MHKRISAVVAAAAVVLFGTAGRASADAYPEGETPVYLVISAPADDFDVTDTPQTEGEIPESHSAVGTKTILVKIGMFHAGNAVADTRFTSASRTSIPLPDGLLFEDLDGNQMTIIGGVLTESGDIHMLSPSPDGIHPDVQIALHDATAAGALDDLLIDSPFPSTYEIGYAVAGYLPEGSTLTVNDVEAGVFQTPRRLDLSDDGTTLNVSSEGELYPHDPGNKVFDFRIRFDEDGDFDEDLCLSVAIDVKPGSDTNPVNRGARGKLPVAILSSDSFDATEWEDADISIAGVAPSHVAVEDVDGDGLDDLICQFSIPALVSAGALDTSDETLTLTADDGDGGCIQGADVVAPFGD